MNIDLAPWVRIIIRLGGGYLLGADTAEMLAADPDVINVAVMAILALNEVWYVMAKRVGWRT